MLRGHERTGEAATAQEAAREQNPADGWPAAADQPSEQHTVIVRQSVPNHARGEYDIWLDRYHRQLKHQPGFASVDVIRRNDGDETRFLILSAFHDHASLADWLSSDTLKDLRNRLDEVAGAGRKVQQVSGREIWFDDDPVNAERAPYWKRVVLSSICVLPSIFVIEFLVTALFPDMPILGNRVLAVFMLTALLTWPIMPCAVRLTRRWMLAKPTG